MFVLLEVPVPVPVPVPGGSCMCVQSSVAVVFGSSEEARRGKEWPAKEAAE